MISQYQGFLRELKTKLGPKTIIVKGINLPVIKAKKVFLEYVSGRVTENFETPLDKREVIATLTHVVDDYNTRINMALDINEKLKKLSDKLCCGYFDVNNILCDGQPSAGYPDQVLPADGDHHLVKSKKVKDVHIRSLMDQLSVR